MSKVAIGFYTAPILFLVITPLMMYWFSRAAGVLAGCIKGGLIGGCLVGLFQFFFLAPLLVKGTDGPGGLVAIILPIAFSIGGLVFGMTVGIIATIVKSSASSINGDSTDPIPAQVLEILRSCKSEAPSVHRALLLVGAMNQRTGSGTWRAYSRRKTKSLPVPR